MLGWGSRVFFRFIDLMGLEVLGFGCGRKVRCLEWVWVCVVDILFFV